MNIVKALWLPFSLTLIATIGALISIDTNVFIAFLCFVAAFVFSLDTWGRFYEFQFLTENYKKHMAKRYWVNFQHTRCAREVMCSIDPEARQFYYNRGYRWYHFIPDNFHKKAHKLSFWKTAIGHRKFL